MAGTTWAVAAIVREPADALFRFVTWYLNAGAAQVYLVFDDPEDPAFESVAAIPGVTAWRATDDFWVAARIKPTAIFVRRQNAAMRYVYANCPFDWLLVCDGDEFAYSPHQTFAERLTEMPLDVRTLVLMTAERVRVSSDPGTTWVRMQLRPRQMRHLFSPEIGSALLENNGMIGHKWGKSFVRTGQPDLVIWQHYAKLADGAEIIDRRLNWPDGAVLVHFYENGYEDWRRKLEYRLPGWSMPKGLRFLLREAHAEGDETRIQTIFAQLFEVDAETANLCELRGLMTKMTPDPFQLSNTVPTQIT